MLPDKSNFRVARHFKTIDLKLLGNCLRDLAKYIAKLTFVRDRDCVSYKSPL